MSLYDPAQASTIQERFKNLFDFLKAYSDLRAPLINNIADQQFVLWLDDLPKHPGVKLNEYVSDSNGDTLSEDVETALPQENDILLEITRPTLVPCPKFPEILSDWMLPGWTKIDRKAEVRTGRNSISKESEVIVEKFEDNEERKKAFEDWLKLRDAWTVNELPVYEAIQLFEKIYELYGLMDRDGGRVELMVGDGLIECVDETGRLFRHPVLLRRLELEFRPEKRNPQFIVRRKDQPPELCIDFLRSFPEIDTHQLARCADELAKLKFDPLGQGDTAGFLRRLIQGLFVDGQYVDTDDEKTAEITIKRKPVIFLRQRKPGLGQAVELILQDISNRIQIGEDFSVAMMQFLGITQQVSAGAVAEEKNDFFANEDTEVLLSKPANKEQLQIAKQLSYRNTVLVQGPPGTGKTHTIANLIGHLLSQGKRILVTAQTPKALRVLRKEIVPEIQALCVSVLQKEKQNLDELQQSVREISVKLSQDERLLEKQVEEIKQERTHVIDQLHHARQQFLDAREDEIREIVFGGKGIRPVDAARKVKERSSLDSWIPSPVTLGSAAPISHDEVVSLYQTNTVISAEDEQELISFRPDTSTIPLPLDFKDLINEITELEKRDSIFGKEYWKEGSDLGTLKDFDLLVSAAMQAIEFFSDSKPWQLEVIQAGRDGESSKKAWLSLAEFVEQTWKLVQESHALVMEYGPVIIDPRPFHEIYPIMNEIVVSFEQNAGSFSLVTRLTKRHWFQFLETAQINGRPLDVKNKNHLLAVQALLRIKDTRNELCSRWGRQMVAGGASTIAELGEKPEQICRQYIHSIKNSLDWHSTAWLPLEKELQRFGFKWVEYLDTIKPLHGENPDLLRLRAAILGDFKKILDARAIAIRLSELNNKYDLCRNQLPPETVNDGVLIKKLRQSFLQKQSSEYAWIYQELDRLKTLEQTWQKRNTALEKIVSYAPAWASAIRSRLGQNGGALPPGNSDAAWEWRQLYDELERRASISLDDLQERIESLNKQLLRLTSSLVAKQTWFNQIKTVKPAEKEALNAYATLQAKKTKSGLGKKDEFIHAAARKEMEKAKGAVPVWIMPLNEVIENFNPLSTRFDVVIIDEASQSDTTAMFALYLGKQAIIVGDDEQVTPTLPGIETDGIMKLIRTYLENIPHKEFYDGETSMYDFAKTAFGNVIRLVEHFRCAPDIIAFSNALSYGDIKPLREESSISLRPNVIPFRVEGKVDEKKVNRVEAENTAALLCAALEQPEYENKTFGVISLLGERQAAEIEAILQAKISSDTYQQRDILCGNAAHFQGDQRDVMFLSMVDAPDGGPLYLRDADANRKLYKKRYNVAASRAKDQMWLVYSLNPETDLKPGDIRKRLIEHMHDPKAWQRELEIKVSKTESPFEERVLSRLLERGFKVQPQFPAGAYRIDLVVSGGGKRVALECDGEQWHGIDKLQDDIERQAILERLGWTFIRIRGSVFFRDPERAMSSVYHRLEELGIGPERESVSGSTVEQSELINRITFRSQQMLKEWQEESSTSVENV